jgi:hypothetical protein
MVDSATEVRQALCFDGDGATEFILFPDSLGEGFKIIGNIVQIGISGALHRFHTLPPHVLVLHAQGSSDTPASKRARVLSLICFAGDGIIVFCPFFRVPLNGVALNAPSQPANGFTQENDFCICIIAKKVNNMWNLTLCNMV